MYQLFDGAGDLDTATTDKISFIIGARQKLTEYINDCIYDNIELKEYQAAKDWSLLLTKLSTISTINELNSFVNKHLSHTIKKV